MQKSHVHLRIAAIVVIVSTMFILLITTLWLAPAKALQVAPTAGNTEIQNSSSAILSSSFDIWQAGKLQASSELGLYPDRVGAVTANFQLGDFYPVTYTVMGVVGAAPLTTTVTTARVMIERDSFSEASGIIDLAVCEGSKVIRSLSVAPLAANTAPERVWIDIPLIEPVTELMIAPGQYLCWTGVRTTPGTINVYMVIQAAVRYWAEPSDFLYLSSISQ